MNLAWTLTNVRTVRAIPAGAREAYAGSSNPKNGGLWWDGDELVRLYLPGELERDQLLVAKARIAHARMELSR